jgi:RNA polymerase sigma-70 factor (sigma-E family)
MIKRMIRRIRQSIGWQGKQRGPTEPPQAGARKGTVVGANFVGRPRTESETTAWPRSLSRHRRARRVSVRGLGSEWNLLDGSGSEVSRKPPRGPSVAISDSEFSEFFAIEYARLCWLGCALTGSPAQAEELAQEALVRLWWRWRLVGQPKDPASYVRRVLVNRHRSLLRRAAVEARSLAKTGPEQLALPAGDEQAMVLWQAVQALPVRQRAVLVLRYYEDRTEAEVAQLLGLQVGTVKSRTHRALARLRDQLESPTLDPVSRTEEGP